MKKKLLFVIPSLDAGGAEKSLVNLLNLLDFGKYEVDLFLFSYNGVFMKQLPREVRILKEKNDFAIFKKPLQLSLLLFLLQRQFSLAKNRFLFYKTNKSTASLAETEQQSWKYFSFAFSDLEKEYDVAIAYLEKSSVYLVDEKVKAKKKLAWIHTNYETSGMNPEFDRNYFSSMDALVTISAECENSLKNYFPKSKTQIIENISSGKLIRKLSEEITFEKNDKIKIVTVARLSKEKGVDLALEAAHYLKENQLDFIWEVIGKGPEKSSLEAKIQEWQLENYFKLLGLKENPYPFIKNTDIYVQPSRYEGKSIAIDEALILKKPVIVTNFSTAKDQISDGETGLIANMDAKSLAEKIMELIQNKDLKNHITENLKHKNFSNEDEIEKFYKLINE